MRAAAGIGGGGQQQQKRKKWTEEEERTLMDKYEEMQADGSLRRLRTREKRFRPIAGHVNACHHGRDPLAYPFAWSWKDTSTKVQNMRHQFLLVKQKLLQSSANPDAIDWNEGLSLWPNFLRYKHVFGDAPLPAKPTEPTIEFPVQVATDDGDLGLGLGFDCCAGEEGEEDGFNYEDAAAPPPPPPPRPPPPLPPPPQSSAVVARKKKKKKKLDRRCWAVLAAELARLRDREVKMEEHELERERERRRRERAAAEAEEAREEQMERMRREAEERERRMRGEEREWEERMEQRRVDWRKRMENILARHREEMEQIHARVLHEQQSIIGQLLGVLSQWPGPGTGLGAGLADGTGMGNHGQAYLSQMMQGLHHVNGMVPGENRVGGDSQDDQFIVDD